MSTRTTRSLSRLLTLLAALLLVACQDAAAPATTTVEKCPSGTKDCPCATGAACGPGLSCAGGTCIAGQQGELGMACFANMTCGADAQGKALVCVSGVCQKASCTQGAEGCGCLGDASCAAGLTCDTSSGVALCQKASCANKAGSLGCACNADLTCGLGDNGAKLACDGKLCVTATCTPGTENCFCGANSACAGGLTCDAKTFTCHIQGCTEGTSGCACKADGSCVGDKLRCDAATSKCIVDNCPAGQSGCSCKADGTCNVGGDELLMCQGGKCLAKPACPEGSPGCACTGTKACAGDGFVCDAATNTCKAVQCAAGALNCGCKGDKTCDSGLVCANGQICVDNKGFVGGACLAGDLCNAGAKCVGGTCQTCAVGSDGCGCFDNGSCFAPLVCNAGACGASGTGGTTVGVSKDPPKNAQCWTACQDGLTRKDGTYVPCEADGLMAGCIDGAVCQSGSCVKPGDNVPLCKSDLDCPEHQTCYLADGHCYSNCNVDSECGEGANCYRHVCRQTCSTNAGCSKGQYCKTVDGEHGFCLPLAPPVTCPGGSCAQKAVLGAFALTEDTVSLTDADPQGRISIEVDTATATTLKVRKVSHNWAANLGIETTCLPGSSGCACDPKGAAQQTIAGQTWFCDATKTPPLYWLQMGLVGKAMAQGAELSIDVPAGKSTFELNLLAEGTPPNPNWNGVLEVTHPTYGTRQINLHYSIKPDGKWSGTAYFFATFEDEGVDKWLANPNDFTQVKNAFIQQWQVFRKSPDAQFELFSALMKSVIDETWQTQAVKNGCKAFGDTAACVPYAPQQPSSVGATNGLYKVSPDARTIRMPGGVTELPLSMNLKTGVDPTSLQGRINTGDSLQYGGNPLIKGIKLKQDPSKACAASSGLCVIGLSDMQVEIGIGGRYATTSGDTGCAAMAPGTYGQVSTPWLVPGFLVGTETNTKTNQIYRYECRSKLAPYGNEPSKYTANLAASAANPIADGKPRKRTLTLLDGALINQTTMVVLFRETMPSFLGDNDAPSAAYGFMVLNRNKQSLEADQFAGTATELPVAKTIPTMDKVGCSKALVETVLGPGGALSAANASTVAKAVINGTVPVGKSVVITDDSPQKVHYFCEDTNYFDAGPKDYPNVQKDFPNFANNKIECPVGSKVTYFTLTGSLSQSDCPTNWAGKGDTTACIQEWVARQPCQMPGNVQDGTCFQTFQEWKTKGPAGGKLALLVDPPWKCTAENQNWCDYKRDNLRTEKTFFVLKDIKPTKLFTPLTAEIEQAFRYKTRFRNRFGKNVGFTPTICVPNSNAVPYCYDPPSIENIRERVDCVADIYTNFAPQLDATTRDAAHGYLKQNYGFKQEVNPVDGTIENKEGFEKLYVELLVMLGDDSYVKAFGSRFDLAGTQSMVFEGSKFEDGGITLSGTAGVEMVELYKAIQYYQLGLDRFFRNAPLMWASINPQKDPLVLAFLGQETVEAYFTRLTRASIQKTRAWNAIAQRYVSFNNPNLARAVVERAYTAAYLESVILGRMMLKLLASSKPEERDQILSTIEKGQIAYRSAMLDMRNVYTSIQDTKMVFGLQPDYIPFPALDASDGNAFDKALKLAKEKLNTAAAKEDKALMSTKSYDTDEVAFQNELINIRNNYENQLADICGTFKGSDGKIYPAITKYANMTEKGQALGNICGLMKTGKLSQSVDQLDIVSMDLKIAKEGYEKTIQAIQAERTRVQKECNLTWQESEFFMEVKKKELNLTTLVNDAKEYIAIAKEGYQLAKDLADTLDVSVGLVTNAPGKALQFATLQAASLAEKGLTIKSKLDIKMHEEELAEMEVTKAKAKFAAQCEKVQIQGEANIHNLVVGLKAGELEIAKAMIRVETALNEVTSLRNEAQRLMAEQAESEQLTINLEAAKNDPNTRVYKNDDVLTADRTFQSAIKEAYKATKVFEYYTSQSYAKKNDLFLVRMVNHGDTSLEKYLAELADAYQEFGELYGVPDQRVAILSLRDDILKVPYSGADGVPYTEAQRVDLMRKALADVKLLDARGYLTIAFPTTLTQLSPLTRNHKVEHLEAELVGSQLGDTLGRVYLVQSGTGTIRSVAGDNQFYTLPERTAVVNSFFNGVKVFPKNIYESRKHKDRPYANGKWQLVINQKDEMVNQDINLQSLHDLRVYVYYTDVTAL